MELTIDQALQKAVEAHKAGKLQDAENLYRAILHAQPKHPDANHNLGVLAVSVDKSDAALPLFKTALEANSNQEQFWLSYIDALIKENQFDNARNVLEQGKRRGFSGEMVDVLEARLPKFLLATNRHVLLESKAPTIAQQHIKKITPIKNENKKNSRSNLIIPNNTTTPPQIKLNSLLEHISKGQKDLALKLATNLTQVYPNHPFAWKVLGALFQQIGKLQDSVSSNERALEISPNDADTHYNLGITLQKLGYLKDAEISYKKAILIKPDFAEAHSNLGNILQELGRLEEAMASYKKATGLKPDYSEAHINLGNTLKELGRLLEAKTSYEKAILIKPDFAEAHSNLGLALQELGSLEAAELSYKKAIKYKPGLAGAHSNLGMTLQELGQFDSAVASFDKAFDINSDIPYLSGMRQYARAFMCDWSHLAKSVLAFESEIYSKPTTTPFIALTLVDKPALHLQSSKNFVDLKWPKSQALGGIAKRTASHKIRLGYFSADFRYHPVAIYLIEQIENHDKSKFELFAFSFRSDIKDPMTARLEAAFDHFIEVDKMSNLEVAQLSRQLGVDIAVDLTGHTKGSRIGIFALQAAPIQVSHLGFPSSMGAEYIDYIISDRHLLPEGSAKHYTEKIAYVPCWYTYDRQRQLSAQPWSRAQVGLPEKGFVFTCQNVCTKFQPEVFDIWMDILKAVPASVLWLMEPSASAVANLRKEAQARGVQSDRLVFTKREIVPGDQEKARIGRYLASYKLADLFLDTWPYNAGTTAIDALWAGLPVITKTGVAMVARLASSVLHAIEVAELITNTAQEYRDLAVELASNPQKLKIIKDKLQENKLTTALFDPAGNIRHIEAAYVEMYRRYQADLPLDHIYIDA